MREYKDAFFWLVGVLAAIGIALGGWNLSQTVQIDARLRVVEDSRFTSSDALQMEMQMRQELHYAVQEIKDCLNDIQKGHECD